MAEASSTEDVITLRIRFKSETLEKFIERYAADLGPNEVFVRTREPLPVGTPLALRLHACTTAAPLIAGRGTVIWTREPDVARTEPAGMGIRFDNLTPHSRADAVADPRAHAAREAGGTRSPPGGHAPAVGCRRPRPSAPMATAATPRLAAPSTTKSRPNACGLCRRRGSGAHRDCAHASELLLRERRGRDPAPATACLKPACWTIGRHHQPARRDPDARHQPGPRLNAAPEAVRRESQPPARAPPPTARAANLLASPRDVARARQPGVGAARVRCRRGSATPEPGQPRRARSGSRRSGSEPARRRRKPCLAARRRPARAASRAGADGA